MTGFLMMRVYARAPLVCAVQAEPKPFRLAAICQIDIVGLLSADPPLKRIGINAGMTGFTVEFLKAGIVVGNKGCALSPLLIGYEVVFVVLANADLSRRTRFIRLIAGRA